MAGFLEPGLEAGLETGSETGTQALKTGYENRM
jgi:hypothetical protein